MSREDENLDELFRNADRGKIPPFDDSWWNEMEELMFDDGAGVDELFAGAAVTAPPYKEAYWKEMEAMLPERKRRAAFWWWYAAAGCLLIGSFPLFMMNNNSGNNSSGSNIAASGAAVEKKARPANGSGAWPENNAAADAVGISVNEADFTPLSDAETGTIGLSNQCTDCEDVPAPAALTASKDVNKLSVLETGVSYSMALARFNPQVSEPVAKRFYVQAGAGAGQSYMRTDQEAGFTHFYTLGAGLYQHSGNFVVTFGLQGKLGFINNISSIQPADASRTHYRELYSVETPLTIGWRRGACVFGVGLTPGIQAGYSGMYVTYDETGTESSRSRVSGKVPAESTLTMQFGLNFARILSENWMLGGQLNADVLTPYGNGAFEGETRKMPVNGSVFLRRSF